MNKHIESLIDAQLQLNNIDVYKIVYKGHSEFLINDGTILSFNLLKKCRNYDRYENHIKSFLRLLKLSKLKNKNKDIFIGDVIYENSNLEYKLSEEDKNLLDAFF